MRNKATESIKASKRKYFSSAVNDNKDNPKAMWKTMKKLLPSKKAKIPGSFDYQGQTYTSPQEIASCYNSFFTIIAKDLTAHLPPLEFNVTNKLTSHILKLPTVNAQNVKIIINKLKNSKGIGLDNISMNIIKTLNKSESFILILTSIINVSFESSTFPTVWKNTKLVPIFKSGEAGNMDNL